MVKQCRNLAVEKNVIVQTIKEWLRKEPEISIGMFGMTNEKSKSTPSG